MSNGNSLLGVALLTLVGIGVGVALSRDEREEPESEFDWESLLRPGRAHELNALRVSIAKHPRSTVLDNPWIEYADGTRGRPDNVVVDRRGRVERVVEAKDVERLRASHVLQTAKYDEALGPTRGSIVAIPARTQVPDRVELLAQLLDVKIRRI